VMPVGSRNSAVFAGCASDIVAALRSGTLRHNSRVVAFPRMMI
jgi:hypothetical protein